MGLSYERLKAGDGRLIVLALSPYGATGPYSRFKGHEINCASLGGVVMSLGLPGRPPLNPPQLIGHLQAGFTGAMASMIVLTVRDFTGIGQHIDLAESDSWAAFHTGMGLVQWMFGDRRTMRHGRRVLGGPLPEHDPPL